MLFEGVNGDGHSDDGEGVDIFEGVDRDSE